jgi:gluconate kinase
MIYLLFGEMGVGKNYVGERMARQLGCPFLDGDDAIPDWMMWKVERFKILSLGELDRYTQQHLVPAIYNAAVVGRGRDADLVVAQALYRRRHRRMIIEFMERHKVGITPVWLKPPSLMTHIRRLWSREHGFHWLVYAAVTKPFFQRPAKGTAVIVNETGDDLAGQIGAIARKGL